MPNIISYFTQSSVDGYFLGEMFDFWLYSYTVKLSARVWSWSQKLSEYDIYTRSIAILYNFLHICLL